MSKSKKNPTAIAVIPARAGSKRIVRKNTVDFFGHPMLAYTVVAAINSNLFDRVLVTTDSTEIGAVAETYGAEYLARPSSLATDTADLVDVTVHAIQSSKVDGKPADIVVQLMPNIPLRRASDIQDHFQEFTKGSRDFQISVTPYRAAYPQWALTRTANGVGGWLFGDQYNVASQELEASFCPTGAIWIAKTSALLTQRNFYGKPFHVAVMDANRGIDIDTVEDLDFAITLVTGLNARADGSVLEPVQPKSRKAA